MKYFLKFLRMYPLLPLVFTLNVRFSFSTLLEKHLDEKTDDPKLQSQREAQWKELINALLKASDQVIALLPSY